MKAMNVTLWVFVVGSALLNIVQVYWHREALKVWQVLDAQRQSIDEEYSRLLIEKNALSAHSRVEKQAKKTLHMHVPTELQVIR